MRISTITLATIVAAGTSSAAFADYTITQSSTQTQYAGHFITFDEPGVPTGATVDPLLFYQASDGIVFSSNSPPSLIVDDWDALDGIAGGNGTGNSIQGGFGIRLNFDTPIVELDFQGWAPGSPAPPFGGINVLLFLGGDQVGSYSGISPFGTDVDSWFNIVATGGDTFDEVVFFNGAFNSFSSYMDNVSWNVPAPGALALLGVAGLFGIRRRRA